MRARFSKLALLLGSSSALGCVPDFEDNLSTIDEPRLLAIQSEPAEVSEGGSVTLRALVAAPGGEAAPAPTWSLCLARKPLTELGPVATECLTTVDDGSGSVQPLGAGFEVAATLPAQACRLFGPTRPEPKPGELPGRPVDPDTTGGYYQPAAAEVDGAISIGDVRLNCGLSNANRDDVQNYNEQYRPNENPLIQRLELDGSELLPVTDDPAAVSGEVAHGASVTLSAGWSDCPGESTCGDGICGAFEDRATCAGDCEEPHGCSGREAYVSFDSSAGVIQPRREGMRVAWYASAGAFEHELSGSAESEAATDTTNVWRTPNAAGIVTLWLVLRDTRGGSSFQTYRVEVR